MDFVYDNIYYEMENYQLTTKKADWDCKFGQIIQNLFHKYMTEKKSSIVFVFNYYNLYIYHR